MKTILKDRYYCISLPNVFGAPFMTLWEGEDKVREFYATVDTEDNFNIIVYDAVSNMVLPDSTGNRYNLIDFCKRLLNNPCLVPGHILENFKDVKVITEEEILKKLEEKRKD